MRVLYSVSDTIAINADTTQMFDWVSEPNCLNFTKTFTPYGSTSIATSSIRDDTRFDYVQDVVKRYELQQLCKVCSNVEGIRSGEDVECISMIAFEDFTVEELKTKMVVLGRHCFHLDHLYKWYLTNITSGRPRPLNPLTHQLMTFRDTETLLCCMKKVYPEFVEKKFINLTLKAIDKQGFSEVTMMVEIMNTLVYSMYIGEFPARMDWCVDALSNTAANVQTLDDLFVIVVGLRMNISLPLQCDDWFIMDGDGNPQKTHQAIVFENKVKIIAELLCKIRH